MSTECKVKVIADSISAITDIRMLTIEAEYPRIILAELNTHRALGKNSASSRAIPVSKMLDQVRNDASMPVRFGAKNKGMQDAGEFDGLVAIWSEADGENIMVSPHEAWIEAQRCAAYFAQAFDEAGYAKQICNRLIESGQRMKTVISGTDWENLFWLRDHGAADPTIAQLVKMIREAVEASTPVVLRPGEWHVPYYMGGVWKEHNEMTFLTVNHPGPVDRFGNSLEYALTISASCCAQVSFRSLDDTYEKAQGVVSKLNLQGEDPNEPVHASPLEHQATPIAETIEWNLDKPFRNALNIGDPKYWQEGVTHMQRDGTLCSGNIRGFIQHRQLVPNHVKRG